MRREYKNFKKKCQSITRQRQNKFYADTTKSIMRESRNHHNKHYFELVKATYGGKHIKSSGSALLKKDGKTLTKKNKEKLERQVEHAQELLNVLIYFLFYHLFIKWILSITWDLILRFWNGAKRQLKSHKIKL